MKGFKGFSGLPPETKVVAGVSTTGIIAIITGIIQTYWPHTHLPSQSVMLLIAGALGGIIAYFSPHTSIPGEANVTTGDISHTGGGSIHVSNHAASDAPIEIAPGVLVEPTAEDPINNWGKV
jgi:hypothetical protein